MTRRLWQSTMIAMARSGRLKALMQGSRSTSAMARRFVAGQAPADGVDRALRLLNDHGIRSSLFYMGEYVDRLDLVDEAVDNKSAVASALGSAGLDIHVSVDPTQIGHQIDPGLVADHAGRIAGVIREAVGKSHGVHCLMFDMEDASLNDPTIAVHDRLQAQGYPVALTLQAYLKRTPADLAAQIGRGSRVRLVKGAFAAGADIAHTGQAEIKRHYRLLIDAMLSQEARQSGFYPIIATHDTRLHDHTIAVARRNGWEPGAYEFELLLGVREDVSRDLARRGERVRLYVPFGRDWWPHAVRRIGENPRNAWLLARAFVSRR